MTLNNLRSVYSVSLHDLFQKFGARVLGFMRDVTVLAKEFYRRKRWECYTRGLHNVPTTSGAQWISEFAGWHLFPVKVIKPEPETAVLNLLNSLSKVTILDYIKAGKNRKTLLRKLASFAEHHAGFSIDEFKVPISREP